MPNKATLQGRAAIAEFVEGNAGRLNDLLDDIAKQNPLAAFQCIVSLIEFHIPKMQRLEHTGKDGKDLYENMTDEQMLERLQTLMLAARGISKPRPLTLNQQLAMREQQLSEQQTIEHNDIEPVKTNERSEC